MVSANDVTPLKNELSFLKTTTGYCDASAYSAGIVPYSVFTVRSTYGADESSK